MISILSVDDVFTNNKVIEYDVEEYMIEKDIDYEFFMFTNAKEAYEKIKEGVDIVYIDVMMPDIDGLELLKMIRSNNSIKQPYIIIVTALNDEGTKQKALELGANAFISKPFDIREIFASLDRYFEANTPKSEDEFFDFDDFEDFDEEDKNSEIMEELNKTHGKIDAKTFMYDLKHSMSYDEFEELKDNFFRIRHELEEIEHIHGTMLIEEINFLKETFTQLSRNLFYLGVEEFEKLSNVILKLIASLDKIKNIKDEEVLDKIAKYISAFSKELIDWITYVFEYEEAVDVFYANASMFNTVLKIKEEIDKNG